jgi:hypothetical protein
MSFETMNTASHPTMIELFMELQPRCLQLHACLPAFGRFCPSADKAVDLFLDVDERLFHGKKSISRSVHWRKPGEIGTFAN